MARHPYATIAVFLLLAFLAFGISLSNPLIFDDAAFITHNRWLIWEHIPNFFRSAIPTSELSFVGYRPLVMTSLTIEQELFPAAPWVMRLTNLLLHVGVTCLAFLLAQRILASRRLAFLVASFFLLHPIQTNVIGLIWKRSDLLVAAGIFIALLFAQKWTESPKRERKSLYLAFAGALIAFLSKESALILLPLLCVANVTLWKPNRSKRSQFLFLYLPLLILSAAHAWIVFVEIPRAVVSAQLQDAGHFPPSLLLGRWDYFLTQGAALFRYIKLTLFPIKLQVLHLIPTVSSWTDLRFVAAALLVLSSVASAHHLRKRHPAISFGILWYLLWLVPSSSFVPLNLSFDEDRLYLPLFGFGLILVTLGAQLYRELQRKNRRIALRVLQIFPILLCALFLFHDVSRLHVWGNPVRLWTENVRDEPKNALAWLTLAETLRAKHGSERAVEAYRQASQLDATYGHPILRLGTHYIENGDWEMGNEMLQKAFRRNASPADVFGQMGVIAANQGETGKAARYFSLSLAANTKKSATLRNYATLLLRTDQREASYQALRTALWVDPSDSQTQLQLAYLLFYGRQDAKGATILIQEVLITDPENALAVALAEKLGLR